MTLKGKNTILNGRHIALIGGQNFRAVGNYPTTSGRRFRDGLVWRSARLDTLTADDVQTIRALGIKTIADLRRTEERRLNPTTPELLSEVRVMAWENPENLGDESGSALFTQGADADHYFNAMLHLYRQIAEIHANHLSDIYRHISAGALPILIHCSAGKDRTGIAVALLLELLGVERSHVIADYVRTESLIDWDRLNLTAAAAGSGAARMDRLAPVARHLLLRSDARYLAAALSDIETRYGSVEGFFLKRLEMPQIAIESLRERLVA